MKPLNEIRIDLTNLMLKQKKYLLHYCQYIWRYHQRVDFAIVTKSLFRNYYFNHKTIFYDPFRFSNQAILL